MSRSSSAGPLVLAAVAAALSGGQPAAGPDPARAIEELEERGLAEVAPSEMDLAREILESGDERLLGLQVELLEAIAEAHEFEKRADHKELEAIEAELQVRVEQAAYEFLVEQILASGVASYWSMP